MSGRRNEGERAMSVWRTTTAMTRLTAVALTAGMAFTVAGCGGGSDGAEDARKQADSGSHSDSRSDSTGGGVLAEVKGGDHITLAITSAKRGSGNFVTVSGTVTNGSGGIWSAPGWAGDETEVSLKNDSSMAGAKLVDQAGKKRYYILRDTEGRCLCTRFTNGVKDGDTVSWYAQFPAPPRDDSKVDFQVGDMPPATIDISEG
jgi:hypothetical protein